MGIKGVDTSSWVKPKVAEVLPEKEVTTKPAKGKVVKQTKKPWWKIW